MSENTISEITITLEEYKELIASKVRLDMVRGIYQGDDYPNPAVVKGVLGCTTKE